MTDEMRRIAYVVSMKAKLDLSDEQIADVIERPVYWVQYIVAHANDPEVQKREYLSVRVPSDYLEPFMTTGDETLH